MSAESSTSFSCPICGMEKSISEKTMMNGQQICQKCQSDIVSELGEQEVNPSIFPLSILFSLLGAIIGGIAWTAIVIMSEYEIGYLAVLVGFLAGRGAIIPAGKGRGRPLQIIAACSAFFGLLISKYAIFDYFLVQSMEGTITLENYLDPVIFYVFIASFQRLLSPFDLLWVFIAISAAWRIPARIKLQMVET
jgi:hypothetical protein